jgi:ubiquinone/menaquinone biosynthesis C-methylase UbiE
VTDTGLNLYDRYLLPMLVHRTCSATTTMRQRARVVPLARGDVLEVGFGSGLNLPLYDPSKVTKLWGLDPSPELTRMALQAATDAAFEVELVAAGSEEIPLDADRFDTAVLTYTLCTIPDPERGLREIARVLKPGGQLLFCEHGVAPDASVRRWQSRLTPIWRRMSGGCHLDRDVPALLERGGFEITEIETMYLPGWRVASYQYWGTAVAQLPTSSP